MSDLKHMLKPLEAHERVLRASNQETSIDSKLAVKPKQILLQAEADLQRHMQKSAGLISPQRRRVIAFQENSLKLYNKQTLAGIHQFPYTNGPATGTLGVMVSSKLKKRSQTANRERPSSPSYNMGKKMETKIANRINNILDRPARLVYGAPENGDYWTQASSIPSASHSHNHQRREKKLASTEYLNAFSSNLSQKNKDQKCGNYTQQVAVSEQLFNKLNIPRKTVKDHEMTSGGLILSRRSKSRRTKIVAQHYKHVKDKVEKMPSACSSEDENQNNSGPTNLEFKTGKPQKDQEGEQENQTVQFSLPNVLNQKHQSKHSKGGKLAKTKQELIAEQQKLLKADLDSDLMEAITPKRFLGKTTGLIDDSKAYSPNQFDTSLNAKVQVNTYAIGNSGIMSQFKTIGYRTEAYSEFMQNKKRDRSLRRQCKRKLLQEKREAIRTGSPGTRINNVPQPQLGDDNLDQNLQIACGAKIEFADPKKQKHNMFTNNQDLMTNMGSNDYIGSNQGFAIDKTEPSIHGDLNEKKVNEPFWFDVLAQRKSPQNSPESKVQLKKEDSKPTLSPEKSNREQSSEARMEHIFKGLCVQLEKSKQELEEEKKKQEIDRLIRQEIRKRRKDEQQRREEQKRLQELSKLEDPNSPENLEAKRLVELEKEKFILEQNADREVKRIAKHLQKLDKSKHSKFCPCCHHGFQVGFDMGPQQKAEFLEYVKNLSSQLKEDMEQAVEKNQFADDVSEVSEDADFLFEDFTKVKEEMATQVEPAKETAETQVYVKHADNQQSAGQFSERSAQVQCGSQYASTEQIVVTDQQEQQTKPEYKLTLGEGGLIVTNSAEQKQKKLLDKGPREDNKLDISVESDKQKGTTQTKNATLIKPNGKNIGNPRIGFKETKSTGCGNDLAKERLHQQVSPKDWFFSQLNRSLINEFYRKNQTNIPLWLQDKLQVFDKDNEGKFVALEAPPSPNKVKKMTATIGLDSSSDSQTSDSERILENPQATSGVMQQLSEPEIPYLITMLKNKSEKWETQAVLVELHTQATYTAKMLTKDLIEGRTPIFMLAEQYKEVDRESVVKLLYRCEKLYRAKGDVTKILLLMLKLEHDKNAQNRDQRQTDAIVARIRSMLGQFMTENKIYDSTFQYDNESLEERLDRLATHSSGDKNEKNLFKDSSLMSFDRGLRQILREKAIEEIEANQNNIAHKTNIEVLTKLADKCFRPTGQGARSATMQHKAGKDGKRLAKLTSFESLS